jgi:DNA-binding NarL/FixJ family response regulator
MGGKRPGPFLAKSVVRGPSQPGPLLGCPAVPPAELGARGRPTSHESELATAAPIRVLVVARNLYSRLGIVLFLRGQPGITVVGEAEDAETAVVLCGAVGPDVVVSEPGRPGLDGVQLALALAGRKSSPLVLLVGDSEGDEDVCRAVEAGVRGFVSREAPGEELVAAIHSLRLGRPSFPPPVLQSLTFARGQPRVTRREREVLEQVADGASNREVSSTLGISERTVGLHVSSILEKVGARSRTEAVAIATRRGILRPLR